MLCQAAEDSTPHQEQRPSSCLASSHALTMPRAAPFLSALHHAQKWSVAWDTAGWPQRAGKAAPNHTAHKNLAGPSQLFTPALWAPCLCGGGQTVPSRVSSNRESPGCWGWSRASALVTHPYMCPAVGTPPVRLPALHLAHLLQR